MSSIPKPVRKESAKEVVVFNSKKKESKTKTKNTETNLSKQRKEEDSEVEENQERISLKQAKFDVFKFGIKGFSKEEQENAKMQLAIKLGAAPPKNKCVNYKELLTEKQEARRKKEELLKENRSFEAKILASKSNPITKKKQSLSSKRKSKINKGHVGNIKGHIGSFSNGVLKINKHQLKNISK